MKTRIFLVLGAALAAGTACASWYWPFGGDDTEKPKRISELLAPASLLIDEASDLAGDGNVDEAVEKYRAALDELSRVELENPERVEKPEFATVRNKRAYVNAAIDSLLLEQARRNAQAVAITDTSALEKEYAKRQADRKAAREGRPPREIKDETRQVDEGVKALDRAATRQAPAAAAKPSGRKGKLAMAMADMGRKDYDAALLVVRELLDDKPNDAAALNLRASIEAAMGDAKAAERTLDQCIQSNPRSYYAYYNMARLFLQTRGAAGKSSAARYYETGRAFGGPADPELEKAVK